LIKKEFSGSIQGLVETFLQQSKMGYLSVVCFGT